MTSSSAPAPTAMHDLPRVCVAVGAPGAAGRSARLRRLASHAVFLVVLVATFAAVLSSGTRVTFVVTTSMEPAVRPRDALVTTSPTRRGPRIGDVVIARPVQAGLTLPPIAHRIIGREHGAWRTKGDANPNVDPWLVPDTAITGVVVATVPGGLFQTPWLAALLLTAAVLLALWPARRADDTPP